MAHIVILMIYHFILYMYLTDKLTKMLQWYHNGTFPEEFVSLSFFHPGNRHNSHIHFT